jgi:hypothetical protein
VNEHSLRQFVQLLALDKVSRQGEWLRCFCPLAPWTHGGGKDSHPSFYISIHDDKKSYWNCFGCSEKPHPLNTLLSKLWLTSGYYPHEAALFYAMNEVSSDEDEDDLNIPQVSGMGWNMTRPTPSPVPERIWNRFSRMCTSKGKEYFSWLSDVRGVDFSTAMQFDVRADPERKVVVFPFTDSDGIIHMLRARRIDDKVVYTYTSDMLGLHRPLSSRKDVGVWFGLHLIDLHDPVIVVEGECFPGDAQVLTKTGWVCFSDYSGEEIAQYEEDGGLRFVSPLAVVRKEFQGELIRNESKGFISLTTPKHRMLALDYKNRLRKHDADSPCSCADRIVRVGRLDGSGIPLSDDQIRLCVAVSADATIDQRKCNGYCGKWPKESRYSRWGLTKPRKVSRLFRLLRSLDVVYTTKVVGDKTHIQFPLPSWVPGRLFPHSWIGEMSISQRMVFLDEVALWDGNFVRGRNQTEYNSILLPNVEFVQTLAHTVGVVSTIREHTKVMEGKEFLGYTASLLWGKKHSSWQSIHSSRVPFAGLVYCAQVGSGMLLIRQERKIHVSGNCDLLRLSSLGVKNVIAAGGTKVTEAQLSALPARMIFLGLDADPPGQKATTRIAQMIGRRAMVMKLDWSLVGCKDPGELTSREQAQTVLDSPVFALS